MFLIKKNVYLKKLEAEALWLVSYIKKNVYVKIGQEVLKIITNASIYKIPAKCW